MDIYQDIALFYLSKLFKLLSQGLNGREFFRRRHFEPWHTWNPSWSDQSVLCPSQDLWGDILDIEHYQMSAIFWFLVIYNILPHWSYLTEVSARKSYKNMHLAHCHRDRSSKYPVFWPIIFLCAKIKNTKFGSFANLINV